MDDLNLPIEAELHADPWESDKSLSTLLTLAAVLLIFCSPALVIAAWRWAL